MQRQRRRRRFLLRRRHRQRDGRPVSRPRARPFRSTAASRVRTTRAKIKAPLLIHYAGEDAGINAGWPAWEDALKKHQIRYHEYMYPGVQHGFHNDTTPRYDEAAAKLAWSRTLAFFNENLKRSGALAPSPPASASRNASDDSRALVRGYCVAVAHVLLVDFQFDAAVRRIIEAGAQVARQSVAAPLVRIVAPHDPAGRA